MKPSRSEFLSLRGHRYHVRIWGPDGAPAFFLLHGWCDVSASFQFVVDALQGQWRVIAPDWRGFGLSQWNEGPYWFPDYLADLDALLEHYSPAQPACIAGHSMGGNVAGLYAGVRPERIARFANLEGFGLGVTTPNEAPERLGKWLQQLRGVAPSFSRYSTHGEFAARLRRDNPRLTPERADFLAGHSLRTVDGGLMFAADPCHRWTNPVLYRLEEAKACWRRVHAETIWVAARDSIIMQRFAGRDKEYRERLACFAKAREILLADCGHNIHHDQPERLAAVLEAFFAEEQRP